MQPGPCNMTRRQPRLRFLDKDCLRSARCCQQRGRPFQWAARILGPKVPHATIRGPWTSNRTSKLEARHSRHTQSRFGLLLHQLAVSSFHLAPPNDPDGPPFSPFSEEGPKESVSGVIEADDDGGAPYFDGRPSPPPKWISSQHPESRVETCATHPRASRVASADAGSRQGEATSGQSDQDGMGRSKKVHCSSSETLTSQD